MSRETLLRPTRGRPIRRGFPIRAYVGPNGGGKSTAMVWDTIPALRAGRPVLSTVRILDFDNPRECDDPACEVDHDAYLKATGNRHMAAHPGYRPLRRWSDVMEFRHGEVLLDEVTGVASSRGFHAMPGAVLNHLQQLRRSDVVLSWSAPAWARADVGIRSVTQSVTLCRGLLKTKVPASEAGLERAWHHRRLFLWRTFDAFAFEDFEVSQTTPGHNGQKARLRPIYRDRHWGPGSLAFSTFDTFDAVASLSSITETGICMTCDGSKRRPPCSCDGEAPPARPARSPRGRGGAGSPRSGVALPAPALRADSPVDVAALVTGLSPGQSYGPMP